MSDLMNASGKQTITDNIDIMATILSYLNRKQKFQLG